jgi:predicted HTH transcriptional regulator
LNNSLNIEALIAGGESQTVEFKAKLPPPRIVARVISSFANTEGGVIVFGIREPNIISGIPPELFGELYSRAIEKITGDVQTSEQVINIDGKSIGVIQVGKSADLVGTDEGYFMRFGEADKQLTAEELSLKATHVVNSSKAIDSLSQTVGKQTEEIGKIREAFEKANSWQRKALYALLGAVASGIGKAVLAALGVGMG